MTLQQLKILTTLIIISACGHSTIESKKNDKVNTVLSDSITIVNENIRVRDNIEIAKQFSENFNPDTTIKNGFAQMFNFPDSVVSAFKALRSDRKNQEKYLTLLYLKIYRGHLQCCHQSYEIRKTIRQDIGIDSISDPLLYEFNLITKQFDSRKRIEMISSGIADNWLTKNKQLLEYDKINSQYKLIRTIEKQIVAHDH